MLIRVSLLLLSGMFLFFSLINNPAPLTAKTDYDLLIKNGTVVDGSGRPAYRADLAIKLILVFARRTKPKLTARDRSASDGDSHALHDLTY